MVIRLDNVPFETFRLVNLTEERKILFNGKHLEQNKWEFEIPDSIIRDSLGLDLFVGEYDHARNVVERVCFVFNENGKENLVYTIGVEDDKNFIYAKYKESKTFSNEYIIVKTKDQKDTLISGSIITHIFHLESKNDKKSDIMVRAIEPHFSWFNNESKTYDQQLKSYQILAKSFPDSRYLITNLATTLTNYKSKEDVLSVFNNLSRKHKDGLFGRIIYSFLNGKFDSSKLIYVSSSENERVIQETSKFNLVVFTASWCKPCIEEIPVLKNIYTDLQDKLEITYVSIDKEEDKASFQKVINDYEISWRSLMAYENLENVKQRYFVERIPHCILVSPNLNFEIIDVRKEIDRQNLYKIVSDQ